MVGGFKLVIKQLREVNEIQSALQVPHPLSATPLLHQIKGVCYFEMS